MPADECVLALPQLGSAGEAYFASQDRRLNDSSVQSVSSSGAGVPALSNYRRDSTSSSASGGSDHASALSHLPSLEVDGTVTVHGKQVGTVKSWSNSAKKAHGALVPSMLSRGSPVSLATTATAVTLMGSVGSLPSPRRDSVAGPTPPGAVRSETSPASPVLCGLPARPNDSTAVPQSADAITGALSSFNRDSLRYKEILSRRNPSGTNHCDDSGTVSEPESLRRMHRLRTIGSGCNERLPATRLEAMRARGLTGNIHAAKFSAFSVTQSLDPSNECGLAESNRGLCMLSGGADHSTAMESTTKADTAGYETARAAEAGLTADNFGSDSQPIRPSSSFVRAKSDDSTSTSVVDLQPLHPTAVAEPHSNVLTRGNSLRTQASRRYSCGDAVSVPHKQTHQRFAARDRRWVRLLAVPLKESREKPADLVAKPQTLPLTAPFTTDATVAAPVKLQDGRPEQKGVKKKARVPHRGRLGRMLNFLIASHSYKQDDSDDSGDESTAQSLSASTTTVANTPQLRASNPDAPVKDPDFSAASPKIDNKSHEPAMAVSYLGDLAKFAACAISASHASSNLLNAESTDSAIPASRVAWRSENSKSRAHHDLHALPVSVCIHVGSIDESRRALRSRGSAESHAPDSSSLPLLSSRKSHFVNSSVCASSTGGSDLTSSIPRSNWFRMAPHSEPGLTQSFLRFESKYRNQASVVKTRRSRACGRRSQSLQYRQRGPIVDESYSSLASNAIRSELDTAKFTDATNGALALQARAEKARRHSIALCNPRRTLEISIRSAARTDVNGSAVGATIANADACALAFRIAKRRCFADALHATYLLSSFQRLGSYQQRSQSTPRPSSSRFMQASASPPPVTQAKQNAFADALYRRLYTATRFGRRAHSCDATTESASKRSAAHKALQLWSTANAQFFVGPLPSSHAAAKPVTVASSMTPGSLEPQATRRQSILSWIPVVGSLLAPSTAVAKVGRLPPVGASVVPAFSAVARSITSFGLPAASAVVPPTLALSRKRASTASSSISDSRRNNVLGADEGFDNSSMRSADFDDTMPGYDTDGSAIAIPTATEKVRPPRSSITSQANAADALNTQPDHSLVPTDAELRALPLKLGENKLEFVVEADQSVRVSSTLYLWTPDVKIVVRQMLFL